MNIRNIFPLLNPTEHQNNGLTVPGTLLEHHPNRAMTVYYLLLQSSMSYQIFSRTHLVPALMAIYEYFNIPNRCKMSISLADTFLGQKLIFLRIGLTKDYLTNQYFKENFWQQNFQERKCCSYITSFCREGLNVTKHKSDFCQS